ncbi:MAG: hypothetical protein JSW47_08590 [Phycisphaerales bacterium]|nr:MAG: hypothetical protein JSW47_08590 [Phycisphaerales bacterium]
MATARYSRVLRTIPILIAVCFVSFPAYAKYSGGTGEPNDPYQIATANDLMLLGETPEDYDKHFILTADIDLDPNLPGRRVFDRAVIGSFTGVFDGNDHTISRLTIKGGGGLGLFGGLSSGAVISNLGLIAVDVNGETGIGGLVGTNGGSITASYSTGIVNGNLEVGGLVGANSGLGSITTSHSSSEVSSSEDVGGLVGINGGSITASFSTGTVTGNRCVGGLVGWSYGGSITASSSTGTVSGDYYVGGLIGHNYSDITTSYSTATVSSTAKVSPEGSWHVGGVGGLVGSNAGSITTSFSTGTVNGPANVGGLVGGSGGSIANSYTTGSVSGNENVGGLVGFNWGIIATNYSNGLVSGSNKVGGLVGYNYHKGNVIACFWDIETSGLSQMCGIQDDDASGCDDSLGKKTTKMQTASTFNEAGWDFVDETANGTEDIWKISEGLGYPRLWWQKYNRIYTAEQLNEMGAEPNDWDKHFKLMADIDLSGYTYDRAVIAPDTNDSESGFQGIPFTGVFDGDGHAILNVTITGGGNLGVFGELESGAEVRNLGAVNVNITGSRGSVGGLAGRNGGQVVRCYSTGKVVADGWGVGGLVGYNGRGDIRRGEGGGGPRVIYCYSTCTVIGDSIVGGLVGGNMTPGRVTDSYSRGDVSGNSDVGGLAGWGGEVTRCYSTGTVSGDRFAGGLVGWIGRVINSFWDIQTSGQATSNGGISKTTAEMQTTGAFLEAGWDFVGETANGTDDIWWILEGQDYPRLWWEWVLVMVVDDFESYNDVESGQPGSNPVYLTWFDPDTAPHAWNGGVMGYVFGPTMETVIVHSGDQSAPLLYNNTGTYTFSEQHRFSSGPEDWAAKGATVLSLWFYGDPANTPGQLYLLINDVVRVDYDGDPDNLTRPVWHRWNVDLTTVATNLESVRCLAIGVDGLGATGTLLLDDIGLYARPPAR